MCQTRYTLECANLSVKCLFVHALCMRGPHNPSSFFVVLYIRDARIKRTELKRVKAHLERLAGGRSNDPSRWEKSENKADIYRILLHLEWSEAHPESLGFLRPKELRHLEANAAGTVSVQDDDDVIYIEKKKISSQQVDADDFVGLEEHWNQVFIYTFAHSVSKPQTPHTPHTTFVANLNHTHSCWMMMDSSSHTHLSSRWKNGQTAPPVQRQAQAIRIKQRSRLRSRTISQA